MATTKSGRRCAVCASVTLVLCVCLLVHTFILHVCARESESKSEREGGEEGREGGKEREQDDVLCRNTGAQQDMAATCSMPSRICACPSAPRCYPTLDICVHLDVCVYVCMYDVCMMYV